MLTNGFDESSCPAVPVHGVTKSSIWPLLSIKSILAIVVLLLTGTALGWSKEEGATDGNLATLSLEELLSVKVRTASLHSQTTADAPASVTVISRDEIRRFGYRTLAEAMQYVPGFFRSNDRSYSTIGVRGFSLPADYGSRLLVLIDGHSMAAGTNKGNGFDLDFPLDMNLVQQIEVVRGPTSALYGSSGVLATINIITISASESYSPEVRVDTGSFGEKKLQVSAPIAVGRELRGILSGSLFHDSGEGTIYVPEYDSAETNFGKAVGMDGDRGYHLFAKLNWRNWSANLIAGSRQKTQPISFGPTRFNDPGTTITDENAVVDVAYTKDWQGRALEWHSYYHAYSLKGNFRSDLLSVGGDTRERDTDDWTGTNVALRFGVKHLGTLTLGSELRVNTRSLVSQFDVQPEYQSRVSINKPDAQVGVFVQDELDLSARWKLNVGLRTDKTRFRGILVAPRAGLIYRKSPATTFKFLYGRSFRNPTPFELFFEDGLAFLSNPQARAENSNTFEIVAERRIRKRVLASLSTYHYGMNDMLIALFTPEGLLQHRNIGKNKSYGVEASVSGRFWHNLELSGSLAVQRTVDSLTNFPFPNSPGQVGKMQAAVPLFEGRLSVAGGFEYLGQRQTMAGATLPRRYLPDLVISTNRLRSGMDFQVGVRNLFHRAYADPVSLNSMVDTMRSPGRNVFVNLIWRASEPTAPRSR